MSMAVQEVAAETMAACEDPLVKKQLAYLLGRQGVVSCPLICGSSLLCVHAWRTRGVTAVTCVPTALLSRTAFVAGSLT